MRTNAMRRRLSVLVLALSLLAAACGGGGGESEAGGGETEAAAAGGGTEAAGGGTEAAAGGGGGEGLVAVLLPDSASSSRWESDDRPAFEAAFEELGLSSSDYQIQNAEGDAANQQQQAEQAITNGASVIVMTNLDSGSGAAIHQIARDAGVAVIDYDRLTLDSQADYYVSFDNEAVGRLQGETLVECVEEQVDAETPQVAVLNGSPTDNNATLFKNGYDGVINPKFESGEWAEVDDQSVPEWDNQQALVIFEQMYTAAGGDINAVLAANDGLANAVVQVLLSNNAAGIPVTGQDATVEGLQNIVQGYQCMTVYKAIPAEAEAAAELAVALRNGEQPETNATVDTGTAEVPAVLLEPTAVTGDNIMDTVVADGFRTVEEICSGDVAETEWCQQNG
jgi:D-xylose transport system substrate-binding protein